MSKFNRVMDLHLHTEIFLIPQEKKNSALPIYKEKGGIAMYHTLKPIMAAALCVSLFSAAAPAHAETHDRDVIVVYKMSGSCFRSFTVCESADTATAGRC
jgi:hypothetical protein